MNPVNSEHVLRPVTMQICARDSVDRCDSQSSQTMIPQDQMSTFVPYSFCLTTSGVIQ